MKSTTQRLQTFVAATLALALHFSVSSLHAADRTWTGGGGDDFWSTPANWGGMAISANDTLLFGGNVRLNPNNDFPAGTVFGGISILNPSGPFTLRGNGITLGGDIRDEMPLVQQTIQFPLTLNASRTISVAQDGLLTLSGIISGTGVGLTKTGDGQLTLSAANTFSGRVRILGGTISVGSDSNLGTASSSPTPGQVGRSAWAQTRAWVRLQVHPLLAIWRLIAAHCGRRRASH
jgi:autotransporter-associated beta strand protein